MRLWESLSPVSGVQTANLSFLKFLSLKYPQYEFSRTKKIRTLIETTRNPGIFSYLLKIDGICDFEKICEYYNTHLIDKRNKSGELRFPKLRRKLLSCWGHYAWMKDDRWFLLLFIRQYHMYDIIKLFQWIQSRTTYYS